MAISRRHALQMMFSYEWPSVDKESLDPASGMTACASGCIVTQLSGMAVPFHRIFICRKYAAGAVEAAKALP